MSDLKKRDLWRTAAICGALAVGAAACSNNTTPTSSENTAASSGNPHATASTVGIGFVSTLTGPNAVYGLSQQKALEYEIATVNAHGGIAGHPVKIVETLNDGGDPSNATITAQRLCDNPAVDIAMGYSDSDITIAAAPVITTCKLPTIGLAVTAAQLAGLSKYLYMIDPSNSSVGVADAKYAVTGLRGKRIAVLYLEDSYGEGIDSTFVKEVAKLGSKVVSNLGYGSSVVDFSSQLSQVQSQQPDLIYLAGFYSQGALIAKQARGAGISTELFGSGGNVSPDLFTLGGSAVNGMYLETTFDPAAKTSAIQAFDSGFEATYHTAPDDWAALTADAFAALTHAVQITGGTSRADIQKGLGEVNFTGVTGHIRFNSQGERPGTSSFVIVRGGKFVPAP